jgi:hypothetical protein
LEIMRPRRLLMEIKKHSLKRRVIMMLKDYQH